MLNLFSPAKINLFLRIVSKRPDGYHHLSSVFQSINLGDTLQFELSDIDELTSTHSQVPLDQSNLIWKAIERFRHETGTTSKIKIHLEKKIPLQAGLGGGSSNAATAMWAYNQLTNSTISEGTLQKWGASIGSDVPFFFSQGSAYCSNRGEAVYSIPSLPQKKLWIIKPEVSLPTQKVYNQLNFKDNIPEKKIQRDLEDFLSGRLSLFNDLEKPAFEIFPELSTLKNQIMHAGFETVLMSGSGSAFFCWGNGVLPSNLNASIFPASYISRSKHNWYEMN